MKKFLLGVALLLISADMSPAIVLANSNDGSNCTEDYPSGYTGGATPVRVFHLNDGSTVTITSTGAVIKQSRCESPYRQGWVNPADICNINSAETLSGQMSSGSSNPHGSQEHKGCPGTTNPAPTPPPAASTQPAQTQRVLPAATSSTQPTPVQSPAKSTLPNTGAGSIAAIGAGATIFGTIAHYLFSRRYGP